MKSSVATSITLLVIAIGVLFFAIFNDTKHPLSTDAGDTLDNIEKTLTPYDAKDKMKKEVLVTDFTNSSVDHEPTNVFTKSLEVKGTIAGGYLYVKASVDQSSLTKDDDVYLKLTQNANGKYSEFGGHLIESQSLATPKNATSTELLFELSSVRYKKAYTDSNLEVLSGNWLNVLNNGNSRIVLGFVSTERKGEIEELAIYYECLEQTSCNISGR